VGLIAGWLAGQVMKGGGYGPLVDIVLGILGSIVGDGCSACSASGRGKAIIGAIIVSFVGAVILIAIARAIKRG